MSKSTTTTITKSDLKRDITLLSTLPTSTLSALMTNSSSTTFRNLQTNHNDISSSSSTPSSAIDLLNAYEPSRSTPEESTTLIKGYIAAMDRDRVAVEGGGDGGTEIQRGLKVDGLEDLGDRIDTLRRRGGEIADCLEGVRV